jgi:proteic killer suppression protein
LVAELLPCQRKILRGQTHRKLSLIRVGQRPSAYRSRTAGSGQSTQQGQPRVIGAPWRDAQINVDLTVNRLTGNVAAMSIQSFACSETESLFTTGKCRRFVNIKSVAERKLAQLDAAPSVSFMKAPPGNDLKEYDGAWHVRINDQWRLTFKWGESGPYDVLIEDPH